MFSTLNAERARKGLSWKDVSERAGINYSTLTKKLYDGSDFTVKQAISIKKAIGVDVPVDELFKWEE